MTAKEAIKQLQTEHDLIAQEHDLDGSQFAPELLEALAMAIEVLKCSEIPNCSEPKCADGCIYGWGSSECGHCDYRSEEPKTGDTISRKAAIDVAIKADIENHGGVLSEKRARIIDKRISAMPPAQPEQRWIPCSERLPDKSGMYLITEQNYGFKVDAICKNVVVHPSYFSVDEKEFKDTVYIPDCSNITAWMPLPEPYMRGEQDAEIR